MADGIRHPTLGERTYLELENLTTHASILEAIEDGDEELAERLMRAHIRYGRDQVLAVVRSWCTQLRGAS